MVRHHDRQAAGDSQEHGPERGIGEVGVHQIYAPGPDQPGEPLRDQQAPSLGADRRRDLDTLRGQTLAMRSAAAPAADHRLGTGGLERPGQVGDQGLGPADLQFMDQKQDANRALGIQGHGLLFPPGKVAPIR